MDEVNRYFSSKGELMAMLIPCELPAKGVSFLTEDSCFQQVASMARNAGDIILPHEHNRLSRVVDYTCETLIIRKGLLQVDLYEDRVIRHTFSVSEGDILSLFSGGHGFRALEDVDMVEIKQGPFMGPEDKTRF